MTRRRATIHRRVSSVESLDIITEVAAAGALWSWITAAEWTTGRFWVGLKQTHGPRLDAKVHEACPGCRAGYRYAVGEFPPVPLLKALPPEHLGNRDHLDVDGVRHWFIGEPWQRCQAEHLRDAGEVDGAEWRRYVRWRDAGFPPRYVPDQSVDDRPMRLVHLCY